jgi:hypothetical protein
MKRCTPQGSQWNILKTRESNEGFSVHPAALFTLAKKEKLQCPAVDAWKDKTWKWAVAYAFRRKEADIYNMAET